MIAKTKEAFNTWAESFSTALSSHTSDPLNSVLQGILLSCLTWEGDEKIPAEIMADLENFFFWKLGKSRSEILELNITDPALVYLCSCLKTPANIVMILAVLKWKYDKNRVSLEEVIDMMPWGIPSTETLHKHWDAQKVERNSMESDNLLDYINLLI